MKKLLGILIPTLMCAACATPPSAPGDIRRDHAAMTRVCSALPSEAALARLKQAWERCYVGPGMSSITVPVGGVPMALPVAGGGDSMRVEVEGEGSLRTLVLRATSGKVFLMADVEPTASCSAAVTARGWNFAWDRAAENTKAWLDDPNAPGPALSCR